MKKNIIYLFLCLLSFSCLAGSSVTQEFDKGNRFFQKGDYQKASQIYESILKQGDESAELYFNLGNAYYKSENIASAILNYERAKRLNPSDEDIDFNLKLANMHITDKIDPLPQVFYKRWWSSFSEIFSTDAWAKISISILFISLLLFILYTTSASTVVKKIFFFGGIMFIFSGICSYFLGQHSMNNHYGNQEAILFSPSVYIKSSPDEKSTDLFMLHEGTKVKILDSIGEWKKIRIENGNLGWAKVSEMKVI